MKKEFKCFLTNETLKIGDVVIRPNFSRFEKHVVLGFTKQGIYISKMARTYITIRPKSMYYATYEDDVTQHNIKQYVQYSDFIIVGKYEGDVSQFNQTLKALNNQRKTN